MEEARVVAAMVESRGVVDLVVLTGAAGSEKAMAVAATVAEA